MLGLAWPEILLIGAVAVIAIGPKDLPIVMKRMGGFARKIRLTMLEFQRHWDELPEQVGVTEMQKQVDDLQKKGFEKFGVAVEEGEARKQAAYGEEHPTPATVPDEKPKVP